MKSTRTADMRAQSTAGISEQRKTQLPPPVYAQKSSQMYSPSTGASPNRGKSTLDMRASQEKQTWQFNLAASGIGGSIDRLSSDVASLSVDLRADQDGVADFEKQIEFLKKRKRELEKRITENEQWIRNFDKEVAPFQQRYQSNIQDAEKIAQDARKQSKAAMNSLRARIKEQP